MRVKTCTRCGETKPLDEFPPVRRGEARLQSWCRSCFAEANAKNYVPYYARERQRILARIAAHRDEIRRHIIDYLREHPCVDCGETDIVVLEFDHLGDKVGDISSYAMGGRTWEAVKAEIDKCEVRCANCHRLKTARDWATPKARPAVVAVEVVLRPTQLMLTPTPPVRRCRVCGVEKEIIEFPFRSIARQTRQWICLSCQRAYARHWYGRNRRRQIANVRKHKASRRMKAAAAVLRYLEEHSCVDCGERNPLLLEFDHLRDKQADISRLVQMGASWKRIKAEIDKCQVRCANCHRRKTAERGGWYRTVKE